MKWLDKDQKEAAKEKFERCLKLIGATEHEPLRQMFARVMSDNEAESRGALFELNTIARFGDEDLGAIQIERRPPRTGASATSLDFHLPNRSQWLELLALSGLIVKWFQAPTGDSPFVKKHVQQMANESCYTGRVQLDEARKLVLGASRKAREKALEDVTIPSWLLLDAGGELLENFSEPTDDGHLQQVGWYFDEQAASQTTLDDELNHLLTCPRVLLSFHRWNRGVDEIVVLARSDDERDAARALRFYNLPLIIVRDGKIERL